MNVQGHEQLVGETRQKQEATMALGHCCTKKRGKI